MSASAELAVAFTSPAGEEVQVQWDREALSALDGNAERPWRLSGEVDWDEVEALRVLSGRFEDGRELAIAALRPRGAAGHGEDAAGGAMVVDGAIEELAEVLISTEYGAHADVRRIGLELYLDDDGMPLRVAADATASATDVDAGLQRIRVELELRLGGIRGTGSLEVLSRL